MNAASCGPLWSALGVALAAVGCAPAGPDAPDSATDALRQRQAVGAPLHTPLSFLRAGDASGPRVILVHGTPGSATGWADYLLAPPPGLELVALDRPGFGASGPDGAVPSLRAQAAAVLALLPADGRPVVLLGHSMGAPIVALAAALLAGEQPARLAGQRPTRLAGVVLLAGSLDPAQEVIHPAQQMAAWGPLRWMLPRVLRNANAELMALKPELEALALLLPRIAAKVVIVHGTLDDLVPVANVAFMQARLVGARCVQTVLLDGGNHFLPWNAKPSVVAALLSALDPSC